MAEPGDGASEERQGLLSAPEMTRKGGGVVASGGGEERDPYCAAPGEWAKVRGAAACGGGVAHGADALLCARSLSTRAAPGWAGRQAGGKGVVGGQDQHPTHCTPHAAHAPAHIKQEGWEQAALAGPLALNLVANYALSIISM